MAEQCYHQNVLYLVTKNQDLISSLGLKISSNRIPLLGDIMF